MARKQIIFLCTGNSCRSQMAHGLAEKLAGKDWDVYSAGLEAHGLNPRAVEAMADIGIDISHHTSDTIDPEHLANMDYAITLCGDAEERCPLTPPSVKRLHWPFPDPAKASGTEEEIRAEFRRVRAAIKDRLEAFFSEGVEA